MCISWKRKGSEETHKFIIQNHCLKTYSTYSIKWCSLQSTGWRFSPQNSKSHFMHFNKSTLLKATGNTGLGASHSSSKQNSDLRFQNVHLREQKSPLKQTIWQLDSFLRPFTQDAFLPSIHVVVFLSHIKIFSHYAKSITFLTHFKEHNVLCPVCMQP